MNENYLIHYGVLGMKWGIRRYQNPDGTRTSLGKKRERSEAHRIKNSEESSKPVRRRSSLETTGMGFTRGPKDSKVKDVWKEKKKSDDQIKPEEAKEKIDRDKLEYLDDEGRRKYLSKFDTDTLSDFNKKLQREEDVKNRFEKSIESTKLLGRDAIERMDDKSLKRYLSKLSYDTLKEYDSKLDKERSVRNKIETVEDARKAEAKKAFEKTRDTLNDVSSIANSTASIARNLKNLSSDKNKKSYINPKNIDKMSNEELRKEAERARAVNDYLRETNQTIQKGRNSIDWDKIATIAGIVGTGVAIASSVTSIKNRNQNG